jgi:hypothetical protein
MKQTNEFDDLARRKLEERAFPMEAAHWEDMQRLLALEQRKRRGFYWPLAAGLLLLVGTGLWWQLAQEPAPDVISEVNDVKAADPAELVTAPAATTTPAPLPVIKAAHLPQQRLLHRTRELLPRPRNLHRGTPHAMDSATHPSAPTNPWWLPRWQLRLPANPDDPHLLKRSHRPSCLRKDRPYRRSLS